jgi:hypothetical protein
MTGRRSLRDDIDQGALERVQDDIQSLRTDVRDIVENHLRHIYERLSGLEAKVAILLALGTAVLVAVITQLIQR